MTIQNLKQASWKNGAPIWRDIAKRLEKPINHWAEVNVSKIAMYARVDETVLIPGKLLGCGEIDRAVTVAAYRASAGGRKKIANAGGKVISISELVDENPKGRRVRILG